MRIFLQYLNTKEGISYLQSMIMVAVALFIYEMIIFYLNLIPNIKSILNNFIKSIKIDYDNKNIILLKPLIDNNILLDILRVKNDREILKNKKINMYTIITGISLITALLYLLYLLHKKRNINAYTIIMTTIILLFIFIFQYLFYHFGRKYKYIDSISNEELKYFIIKNL